MAPTKGILRLALGNYFGRVFFIFLFSHWQQPAFDFPLCIMFPFDRAKHCQFRYFILISFLYSSVVLGFCLCGPLHSRKPGMPQEKHWTHILMENFLPSDLRAWPIYKDLSKQGDACMHTHRPNVSQTTHLFHKVSTIPPESLYASGTLTCSSQTSYHYRKQ